MADINKKLQIIAKNKRIDPKSDNLARKVTGLLYAEDLLGQSNKKKAAWLLPGGIIGHDFVNDNPEIITDPEQIINMDPEVAKETPIKVTTSTAVNAMTSATTTYKFIEIVGTKAEPIEVSDYNVHFNAIDKVEVDTIQIGGAKVGQSNGKVLFNAPEAEFTNVSLATGTTVYNVFEGSGNVNSPVSSIALTNSTFDKPTLKHNVLNVYVPDNDATILVKDCSFTLNPETSNVLRMANYTNAENVTVTFENVDWNYDGYNGTDYAWGGLVIYQPASTDVALTGDTSKIATWKFIFKNCKYNGEKVTSVNYQEENQVMYGYNIGNTGANVDMSDIVTITFA